LRVPVARNLYTQPAATIDCGMASVSDSPDLNAQPACTVADSQSTAKRADRPIEGGAEPIARGVLLHTAISRELGAHQGMVSREDVALATVDDRDGLLRSLDDVDGRQDDRHRWVE